jgi:hypothetical protein
MATRLNPPANEVPLAPDGQHTQAWLAHFQQVSDILSGLGVGTTTGSSQPAGNVGEFLTSVVTGGSAVALTSAAAKDVTSLVLSPGDWDLFGSVVFASSGAHSIIAGWMSPASATLPGDLSGGGFTTIRATFTPGATQALPAGRVRFNVSVSTTVYMSALAVFAGTMGVYGTFSARRMS